MIVLGLAALAENLVLNAEIEKEQSSFLIARPAPSESVKQRRARRLAIT